MIDVVESLEKRVKTRFSHQYVHLSLSRSMKAFEEVCRTAMNGAPEELSEQEIEAYVESGEPTDKAGAYAIQGQASRWISRIQGCYFNVVGLPVPVVYRMLREAGCE